MRYKGLAMRKNVGLIALLTLVLILGACGAKQNQILRTEESQVKLRSIQSRVFDTTDRLSLLTTIIATLQDLGFVIDDASEALGTVSGTKRSYRTDSGCLGPMRIPYQLRMTVSVRPRGAYQQFFAALSKALFLEAQQIE
jgi:hypothetical protein